MALHVDIGKRIDSITITALQDIFSNFLNGNSIVLNADTSSGQIRGLDSNFYKLYNSSSGITLSYDGVRKKFQLNPTDASPVFRFDEWSKNTKWQDKDLFTSSVVTTSGSNSDLIYRKNNLSFIKVESNIRFHTS